MRLKTIVKLGVSALLLLLLFRLVDFGALRTTVLGIRPSTVLVVSIGYLIGQLLSAFKWSRIVRASGLDVSYPRALKAYFTGMFVNVLGIGTLGGDMTRALLVAEGRSAKALGLASVVADRAHGLAVLATVGTLATIIFGRQSLDPYLVALLVALGVALVLGWYIGPRLLLAIVPPGHKLRERAEMATKAFPRDAKTVALITAVSLAFHSLQIALHGVMAAGVGASTPWHYLLVAVPFTNIVSSLPISWQGLGVRENAYRFFFVPMMLTTEQALAFGAIWLFAVTVGGLVGGVVAILSGDLPSALERRERGRVGADGKPVQSPSSWKSEERVGNS